MTTAPPATVYRVTLTVAADPPAAVAALTASLARQLTDPVWDEHPEPGWITVSIPVLAPSHVRAADVAVAAFGRAAGRAGWVSLHLPAWPQPGRVGGWRLHRLAVEPG